jgi:hypothetical protein
MSRSALDDYLATLVPDPRAEPMVRELDRVIRQAHSGFDVVIKDKILMYALDGDFHTWVCAINAARKRVTLRQAVQDKAYAAAEKAGRRPKAR